MSTINKQFLRCPFPWFGGKSRVAHLVWQRFGDVDHYIEPFAGSLAVLLGRPNPKAAIQSTETVNDKDCYLVNFWRAVQAEPDTVARYTDWPVNEADLHARHKWLLDQEAFRERMLTDPDYYDARIAGWWAWGISIWIGHGWCKRLARQIPEIATTGTGIASARFQQSPVLYLQTLALRLRRVRVCCGDWSRVLTPAIEKSFSRIGVFLDPPYSLEAGIEENVYRVDDADVSAQVRQWAVEHGDNPKYRIALCGYEGEHEMPSSWECVQWSATGGWANTGNGEAKNNRHRERIWFSPHCLRSLSLFEQESEYDE